MTVGVDIEDDVRRAPLNPGGERPDALS